MSPQQWLPDHLTSLLDLKPWLLTVVSLATN